MDAMWTTIGYIVLCSNIRRCVLSWCKWQSEYSHLFVSLSSPLNLKMFKIYTIYNWLEMQTCMLFMFKIQNCISSAFENLVSRTGFDNGLSSMFFLHVKWRQIRQEMVEYRICTRKVSADWFKKILEVEISIQTH
jgi:hypothetical protein